jgi:hypothetical protein
MGTSADGKQSQAAEPSDFEADLVAVLVVPAFADESDDVDEDELEDELPDSLEPGEVLVVPELLPE